MAVTLRRSAPGFEARFRALLAAKREAAPDVEADVRDIIASVRRLGDEALADHTRRLDRADLSALGIAVSRAEVERAYRQADPRTIAALEFARDRIRARE